MQNGIELTDYEKSLVETFKRIKPRTKAEIDEFIDILIQTRERPEKNPQLKNREGSD